MAYDSFLAQFELASQKPSSGFEPVQASTPNEWFAAKFKSHTEQFGPAFLEVRETTCDGFTRIIPVSINIDFFSSIFSDPLLGLLVVYFEPEMQFYYLEPVRNIYQPTTPEKLQNLYRALLMKCAESMPAEVHKLNLFHEFRSDKVAKAITQRAKSILAAHESFFAPDSPHQRIKGPELIERVARVFVDSLLTSESGQVLRLHDAYISFLGLLKDRNLPVIKRSDFKAVVGPLIREQFDVALRNDLPGTDGAGVRGWKNVKLVQTVPG